MTGAIATSTDLMIVPCPHRGADWAVVNRQGDLLFAGDWGHCARRLRRLADAA